MNRNQISKWYVIFAILFVLVMEQYAHAMMQSISEPIEIPCSFDPQGSGARALGMSGAFISIADDGTASSWNPGCLIHLKKTSEFSFVFNVDHRIEQLRFDFDRDANGKQTISIQDINYLSFSYPFTVSQYPMIVAFSYQHLYDFNREWDMPLTTHYDNDDISESSHLHYVQKGSLSAIGLAWCIGFSPRLSFGLTLNLWNDWLNNNSWEQHSIKHAQGLMYFDPNISPSHFKYQYDKRDSYSFRGVNVNLGLKYKFNDYLTLGIVYKSPFQADLTHKQTIHSNFQFDTGKPSPYDETKNQKEHLDMPMSIGVGLSIRFSDRFTFAIDLSRTEWQDFIHYDESGNASSFLTGPEVKHPDIDPTHQIRIGAEYLIMNPPIQQYVIPIRGGFFYDPAPANGTTDEFFGISLGTGIAVNAYIFDIAYQFRFGKNVDNDLFPAEKSFSQDVYDHRCYASFIYHFDPLQ